MRNIVNKITEKQYIEISNCLKSTLINAGRISQIYYIAQMNLTFYSRADVHIIHKTSITFSSNCLTWLASHYLSHHRRFLLLLLVRLYPLQLVRPQ